MIEEPWLKLLELVRMRLGADDARIQIGGRPPDAPRLIMATLRPNVRVVAEFDGPRADLDRLQERLEALVSAFSGTVERPAPALDIPAPPQGASLEAALQAVAQRTNAVRVLIIDEQSPIVWGSSAPDALPPDIATATSIAQTANALERAGLDLASLLLRPSAETEAALGLSSLSPAEKRGVLGVIAGLAEAGTMNDEAEWRRDILVARAIAMTRRQRDISLVREPTLGILARSFSNIYRIVLVFDGRFSPLQAEAAVIQALPLIESLVERLPPIDPTPGGKVVALRPSRA
jgi:hypothetical protein